MTQRERKLVDLTPYYLAQRRRRRRRERLYRLLALLPQDLSLGLLILYGVLRLLLAPQVPFSYYVGPLTLLWPASFLLLTVSYTAHCLLWDGPPRRRRRPGPPRPPRRAA